MARFGTIGTQYFDSAGDPLASGLLYFYESGTTTAKTTYSDPNLTIANTNPVVLEADGRQPNIFFDGSAKVILTDSDHVQIDQLDPVGGDSGAQLGDWSAITIYGQGAFVIASDGKVYKSLIANNQNNDPTTTPSAWEQKIILGIWNNSVAYAVNIVVQGSDGFLYTSVIANTGNDPVTDDGTNWKSSTEQFSAGDVVFSADTTKYTTPSYLPCDNSAFSAVTYSTLASLINPSYNKLTDPATLPTGSVQQLGGRIPWSSDDVYAAVPHATTPFVTIYKRTGDTFAKLSDPATLPTGTGWGADIDPSDTYLAVPHETTPFVTIYSRSGDTFTKESNPATLPTGTGRHCKFDFDSTHLAVGHSTTPFITVYEITAGPTFTKLTNPATLPASSVYATAWSSDSGYLACGGSASPFINIYTLSGTTLTKVADPATLPSSTVQGVSFDPTDTYLAVASSASPYLVIYKDVAGVFTKIIDDNINPLPTSTLNDVYFDSDGFLYCAYDVNGVIKYRRDGDKFTRVNSGLVTSDDVGDALTFSKSGTGTYSAVGGNASPYVAFYKGDTYLTPQIDVDENGHTSAYIKTGL